MTYIYQITNNTNGKLYVGKTMFSISKRWDEHCRDSQSNAKINRPLYSAIRKYGKENFSIKEIDKTDGDGSELEKYWIEKLGSYKYGYNATIGGDGRPYLDYDLIVATYNEVKSLRKTAKVLNICPDTVTRVLKDRECFVPSASESAKIQLSKCVGMYAIDGKLIKTFSSTQEASKYISIVKGHSHISDVCLGKRKTAYGYIWKYINEK